MYQMVAWLVVLWLGPLGPKRLKDCYHIFYGLNVRISRTGMNERGQR